MLMIYILLLYRRITSYKDCTLLQNGINNLIVWSKAWQLLFNFDKCKFLRITNRLHPTVSTYTMETNIIKQVTSVKYLGITINEKLQWSEHISKITNKANGTVSFLCRNLKNYPSHIKNSCYKSLAPVLEYGCTV